MRSRRRPSFRLALAAGLAALAAVGGAPTATAQDQRRVPFGDDVPPPPPLPVPLDRHLNGSIESWDGETVRLRWDWSEEEQLDDFDPFVPIRSGLVGGFRWADGRLAASGTGGIRLRLGMLDDLSVKVRAQLHVPHDLGVVLSKPDTSDESILCLIQDRFFTEFDDSAGNSTMINKIGGIPAETPGGTEFRYVDRKKGKPLAKGDEVLFTVVRSGPSTSFTVEPDGGKALQLSGKDPDTPMTRFSPGLYVAGAGADFGELEVEGRVDPDWFPAHDVLPHFADDLLHPGNRFEGEVLKAAQAVEAFAEQDDDVPEEERVEPATLVGFVGDLELPMVIRMRAAETLLERGLEDGAALRTVARLLHEGDRAARTMAWQVLRPELPWHFRYDVDAPEKDRKESAELVGHYLVERDDALASGKVFVDGYWKTPARADDIRAHWENAWDLRTSRVRLRTNLTKEWADWYLGALDAAFERLVRQIGHPPPPESLPLSVLLFRSRDDYSAFCTKHDEYAARKDWGTFTDLDRGVALVTFNRRAAPAGCTGALARLFLRRATGVWWPTWYSEGLGRSFGHPRYGTVSWDGTTLDAGRPMRGTEASLLAAAARGGDLPKVAEFLGQDPRELDPEARRVWYAQAWGLHQYLNHDAPPNTARAFARWRAAVRDVAPTPSTADAEGRRLFLAVMSGRTESLDKGLIEFLGRLDKR